MAVLAKGLHSDNSEVSVRALLALGMLLGNSQELQLQLANTDGALPRLLQLRLQEEDQDSQHIADAIVSAMVSLTLLRSKALLIVLFAIKVLTSVFSCKAAAAVVVHHAFIKDRWMSG